MHKYLSVLYICIIKLSQIFARNGLDSVRKDLTVTPPIMRKLSNNHSN